MKISTQIIPHIYRNKYLKNSSASTVILGDSGNNISGISGNDTTKIYTLDTHTFWGQPYNGTQDVNGDMDIVGNCTLTGDLTAYNITSNGYVTAYNITAEHDVTVGRNAYVDVDLHVGDTIYSTYINNSKDITTQNLTVTGQAKFFELVIDKITSMGGNLMITPVDGFTIDYVYENTSSVYLYWRANKDGKAIKNMWKVYDQALCRNFNNARVGTNVDASNVYYWALVQGVSTTPSRTRYGSSTEYIDEILGEYTGTGEHTYFHYIRLSKTSSTYDGILSPEIGQDIVMCGSRVSGEPDRQSALYLATYDSLDLGLKAPFLAQYRGINNFDLSTHRYSYFDAKGARFIGDFEITGELEQTLQEKVQEYMEQHPVATPYIGDNGNWWIDGRDTGVKAEGQDGQDGQDGNTPYIGDNGNWWIGNVDTGVKAQGQDGQSGKDGVNGVDGEDGDDAVNFVLSPNSIVFNTDDSGIVNVSYAIATITAYKGGQRVPVTSPSAGTTTNCGFYQSPQVLFNGVTVWIYIREQDYDYIDTIKGRTYIAPTSGTASLTCTVDGVTHVVTIPVFVNVKKYLNSFSVTQKEFSSQYQEFATNTNNTLTSYYSLIQQNARDISLKVDQVDVYPNYYNNPIYKLEEYRTGTGTLAFGFNYGEPTDRAKFTMSVANSFELRMTSTQYDTLISPFNADGGNIYKLSKNTGTTSDVSLYATDELGTTFLKRRTKLKGGCDYTVSVWVATPKEYGTLVVSFKDLLLNPNIFEINVWNNATATSTDNRTFRRNIQCHDSYIASVHGIWKQYYITFKTPKNEDISLGDVTAHYDSECWLTLEPCMAVKQSTFRGNMYFAGIKVEEGTKATPMTTTTADLQAIQATGIDITNRKIVLTADNIEARNNYGEQTMKLDENGGMVLSSGAVINGWTFNPPVRLNRDNLRRYCILEKSQNPNYADCYGLDLEKLGQYLIVDEFDQYIGSSRAVSVPSTTPTLSSKISYMNGITGGVINETANVCDDFQCVLTATPFQSLSSEQLYNQNLGYLVGFDKVTGNAKPITSSEPDYAEEYVSPLALPSFSYNGQVFHYKCYSLTKDEQITDIRKYIDKSITIVNNSDTGFGINGCLTVVDPRGQQTSGVSTFVPAHSARFCKACLVYKPRTISGVTYMCEELYWEVSQVFPHSDGNIRLAN